VHTRITHIPHVQHVTCLYCYGIELLQADICFQIVSTEEAIEFVRHLENQTASGLPTDVTFECELSRPDAVVQWTKAGQALASSDKYEITSVGTVHRLVVHNVTNQEDVAEYCASVRGLTSKASLKLRGNEHDVI
jgi:Immunoglobulin I-set domain